MHVRRGLAIAVPLHLALVGSAATPQGRDGVAPPRFGARVEVVRVSVLVRGSDRPAGSLTAESFEVEDNGVPQRVDQVSRQDRPIILILALDISGSVRGEILDHLKRACLAAIDELRPGESAQLLTFSGDIQRFEVTGPGLPEVRRRIEALEARDWTALRDAVFATAALADAAPDTSLGIVFTDGEESGASWLREADVRAAVKQGRAVIYGVRIGKPAPPFLGHVVDTSGGRMLRPASPRDLSSTFAEILQEFRTRYFLRYTPTRVARAGWHRVKVRLKGSSGHLTYREAYEAR